MAHANATSAAVTLNRMSRFQWLAIAICVLLNMLDGFDVMVMAFAAPHVSADWGLSGKELGLMLSAGLVGMALGSLVLAPLADKHGRRAMILWCLVILTVGMLASAFAQNAWQLAALRVLTGIGIGGMLAGVGVITAEYASPKWRSTAVALQATGYPIGATIGGLIAAAMLEHWGWHSVFVFGAAASLLCIPVVLVLLPESLDFLVSRRPAGALERLNALLARMQQPALAALPAPPATPPKAGYAALFTPGLRRNSVLIALGFFMHMFAFYFVLSWTPKLLVQAGMSAEQGITGGVLLNLGGIVGGALFGWLASRFLITRLTAGSFVIAAVGMVVFAALGTQLNLAFPVAFVIGAALFGSMAGLYAVAPIVFDASVRTTGLGWAIGIGRIGAILSPMTVGVLVDAGWQPANLYYVLALPLLVAVVAVLSMRLLAQR
ncbi:benzoate transport [Pseudoxanthomonas sp. GM95]|uniref:MFS transporter n=1 Tax=Pseudoxanthomonas sp. GM95 TaxID=1881043 RepID=UPI0008CC09F5|nr:MFS transporter [Pseudoxanthomonas sp. GM95]SEM43784.1 benzoate transport [Pseudoxanthomonas sp. GM95]